MHNVSDVASQRHGLSAVTQKLQRIPEQLCRHLLCCSESGSGFDFISRGRGCHRISQGRSNPVVSRRVPDNERRRRHNENQCIDNVAGGHNIKCHSLIIATLIIHCQQVTDSHALISLNYISTAIGDISQMNHRADGS